MQRLQTISILNYVRVTPELSCSHSQINCSMGDPARSSVQRLCSSFLLMGHDSAQRIAALGNDFHSLPASKIPPLPSFPHQRIFLWLKYSKYKTSAAHTKCHSGERSEHAASVM